MIETNSIDVKCTVVGVMQENCYIVTDKATGLIALVDTGAVSVTLKNFVKQNSDKIKYILLTHGHFDHIGYASKVKEETNAKVVISKEDESFLCDSNYNLSVMAMGEAVDEVSADIILNDGDKLMLGETEITFMLTPGHTKGSGCYIIDNCIFSGDTLMRLSIGRTDFPTGDISNMEISLKRLANLKGDYNVFSGHGDFTTLNYERQNNPYMR